MATTLRKDSLHPPNIIALPARHLNFVGLYILIIGGGGGGGGGQV